MQEHKFSQPRSQGLCSTRLKFSFLHVSTSKKDCGEKLLKYEENSSEVMMALILLTSLIKYICITQEVLESNH